MSPGDSSTTAVRKVRLCPAPELADDAHKGDAGRVLCVVGSETMPGAAVLVARAAQRAGAGLVGIGCLDPNLLAVVPAAAPEAVLVDMRSAFRIDGSSTERASDLMGARDPHARLVGPGIGNDARAREVVRLALATPGGVPLALDADGLNALDGKPERLREHAAPVVITPHAGEAMRLARRTVPHEEKGRVAFAFELAQRSGAIVCLKGRGTVVCDGERAYVNRTGNSGMATAGAGDVLAGILVAYLAACTTSGAGGGWRPFDAAALAVHVHGLAGDLAAAALGRRAVVASDLIERLPQAQRSLDEHGEA